MINDFRKSLNYILSERLTSPFFGAFFFSWFAWNWKIIYVTFFISEKLLETDKITYIIQNYYNYGDLFYRPLISTVVIVSLVPFISNGAYWLKLRFDKWKRNEKDKYDGERLLTIDESVAIRKEISNQETEFNKILKSHKTEIDQLKHQLSLGQDLKAKIEVEYQQKIIEKDKRIEQLQNQVENNKNDVNKLSNEYIKKLDEKEESIVKLKNQISKLESINKENTEATSIKTKVGAKKYSERLKRLIKAIQVILDSEHTNKEKISLANSVKYFTKEDQRVREFDELFIALTGDDQSALRKYSESFKFLVNEGMVKGKLTSYVLTELGEDFAAIFYSNDLHLI